MRTWRRVDWPRAGDSQQVLRTTLAVTGAFVGWRMLSETFILFRNAYLNTVWVAAGTRVPHTYWASIRFAFDATALAAAGGGVCLTLAALEVGRLAHHS